MNSLTLSVMDMFSQQTNNQSENRSDKQSFAQRIVELNQEIRKEHIRLAEQITNNNATPVEDKQNPPQRSIKNSPNDNQLPLEPLE